MKKSYAVFAHKAEVVLVFIFGILFVSRTLCAQTIPSDYFRSVISGNSSQTNVWESSHDRISWIPSSLTPTSSAAGINIISGTTVTIDVLLDAKLLTIDVGGVLVNTNNIVFTIFDDGTNADDFVINGRYELYGTMPLYNGSARVMVHSGGEVRINDNNGGQSDNFLRDTHLFVETGSLFNWNTSDFFQTDNVTYFPNATATATDKAIFRISKNVGTAGAGSVTIFNCKFEVASGCTISFVSAGAKIFRDGLGGAGTIVHTPTSGPFQITSASAVIDGTLAIILQQSNGNALEIISGAVVDISGSPTILVGDATFPGASLYIGGAVIHNGATAVDFSYGSLVVDGTLLGSGMFTSSQISTMTVGASGTVGPIYFTPTKNYLKTLIVKGMMILGNSLNIVGGNPSGMIQVDGAFDTKNFLTLQSDINGTAWVGVSSGTIIGDVTVERFIPPKRAWRFLTVPFSSSTQTISQAWQGGYLNTSLACANNVGMSGFDTHITYIYNRINGYDKGPQNNPSLRTWNTSTTAWNNLSSTNVVLITAEPAYCIFIRGDRTVCMDQGVNATPTQTILRATGILNVGDVTKNFTALPGQYIFVGNPYASSIDLTNILTRSIGIDPSIFYLWDPGCGLNGCYVSYLSGVTAPVTNNYQTPASTLIVQSGQGFFLKVNAPNPSILFKESDKTSLQASVFSRRAKSEIHIELLSSVDQSVLDGTAAFFYEIQEKSIPKFSNLFENIFLTQFKNNFGIEARPLVQKSDTFIVSLSGIQEKEYTLRVFTNIFFKEKKNARLIDKFLSSEIKILGDTLMYKFSVSKDTNSYKHRFMIVSDTIVNPVFISTNIVVYPNPVGNVLYLQGSFDPNAVMYVTDASGRIIQKTKYNSGINCESLSPGIYFLKIKNKTFKFLKQ